MKLQLIFCFLLFAFCSFGQRIMYAAPVPHTVGVPVSTPNSYNSWIRYDKTGNRLYGWTGEGWLNLSATDFSKTGSTVFLNQSSENLSVGTAASTQKLTVSGNIAMTTSGNKLFIASAANASVGSATLVSGRVTISTTAITASSLVFVTRRSNEGVEVGPVFTVNNVIPGTSFRISSMTVLGAVVAADNTIVNWWIIN